ncbi:gluconate 2-dehydrogenase subunit 3 family protein [Aestuariicella hydrocarbonica]|uniref:Gluconate 2-dehydrogenase subunit 3 family protein n=1 Tax=Pseudomaricurvus hydrocarbonicus TaxID=1470433 RepID=A0A9E5T1T6_9GAMM|nr:gluconate 2-dehydrogenase subunit 3 family protein [Aestuariicella hydrocarbonica]NHO67111.1 gluconate 2-dehydrogenase subunit 3 family protein [Aestuariicella hydrocarbonica]
MNRREFLQCAAVLVGSAGVSGHVLALSQTQMTYLASADDYVKMPATLFSSQQRAIVAAAAETIIPRTDTPGAIDAGVPHFIELMVQDWLNDEESSIFMSGLQNLETGIPAELGASYDKLSAEQQLSVLEALEAAASKSPWYAMGNVRRTFISDAPFICQLKELTIWGFFTSEAGVKQVLRYNPMPMKFDGHYPRKPGDTTWAPFATIR